MFEPLAWLILANALAVNSAQAVELQRQDRLHVKAWDTLLKREAHHAERFDAALPRLGDALALLDEQIERIKGKRHLDIARLRVEQELERVGEFDAVLAELDREYARAPEPRGEHKEIRKLRLADKRADLAELADQAARSRKSLDRVIAMLQKQPEPDLQIALEARDHLGKLERDANRFLHLIDPVICYSLIAWFEAIERHQREMSARLHLMYHESLRPPEPFIGPAKKDKQGK